MLSKAEAPVSPTSVSRVAANDGITSRGCKDGDKSEQRKPVPHEGMFFGLEIEGLICVRIV
jgi:hypothetical protein